MQARLPAEPGAVAVGRGEARGGKHTAANADQADTATRGARLGTLVGLK